MTSLRILALSVCLHCALTAMAQQQTLPEQSIAADSSLRTLDQWLAANQFTPETVGELILQPFAKTPLTKDQAQRVTKKLWKVRSNQLKLDRAQEMKDRSITIGDKVMPFWFKRFGEAPASGRSLFISMHGGGGAPAQVNDQQYQNQKLLYQPEEGIYLAPRAPTDTWDLWHQAHIDQFFARLITNMIIFENVNPDRIYLMGYSAGGDGVYQLAPRMADRWAAASMMAGHPNDAKPDGLRNLPFTIHVGARDSAYNRNKIAGQWKTKLAALQAADVDGYIHEVEVHAGRGHWMNLEDAVAVPWMSKFERTRFPDRVVWRQGGVVHDRFYWLQATNNDGKSGQTIVATVADSTVQVEESDLEELTILLHDDLVDMDSPVVIQQGSKVLFSGSVSRSIGAIADSLLTRNDPRSVVYGRVPVKLKVSAR